MTRAETRRAPRCCPGPITASPGSHGGTWCHRHVIIAMSIVETGFTGQIGTVALANWSFPCSCSQHIVSRIGRGVTSTRRDRECYGELATRTRSNDPACQFVMAGVLG